MTRASVLRILLLTTAVSALLSCSFAGPASAKLTKVFAGNDEYVAFSINGDSLYWTHSKSKSKSPQQTIYRTNLTNMSSVPLVTLGKGMRVTQLFSGTRQIVAEVSRRWKSGKRTIYAERTSIFTFDLERSTLIEIADGKYFFDRSHSRECGTYPSLMGVFDDEPFFTVSQSSGPGSTGCTSKRMMTEFFTLKPASAGTLGPAPYRLGTTSRAVHAAGRSGNDLIYANNDAVRAQTIGQEPRILLLARNAQFPILTMNSSGQAIASLLHIGKDGYLDKIDDNHLFEAGAYNAPGANLGRFGRMAPCGDRIASYEFAKSESIAIFKSTEDGPLDLDEIEVPRSDIGVTCSPKWIAFMSVTGKSRKTSIYATEFAPF